MLTPAVYLHDLNPFVFRLPGGYGVRWYGLSYLLGFFLGYWVIRRVVRVGVSTLKVAEVADLVVTLAIGIVVGGRLGYVLFYRPDLLAEFSAHLPFWAVLELNKGGMASHGGMIGGILASLYYARRHHHPWPHLLDLFAFGAPLGLFFGRIANFINGELFGRPCLPNLPWAVKFPQEMFLWNPSLPAERLRLEQLDAVLPLLPESSRHAATWDQQITAIIDAIQSGNRPVAQVVAPLLTPRHPSQLYEALLEGLVLFAALLFVWRKPRKPLVVGAWFAIVYGIVRIIAEFFRMPDAHIASQEFAHLGVTRGQWLSLLLILVGLVLLAIFSRRNVPPMGGWRKAS